MKRIKALKLIEYISPLILHCKTHKQRWFVYKHIEYISSDYWRIRTYDVICKFLSLLDKELKDIPENVKEEILDSLSEFIPR